MTKIVLGLDGGGTQTRAVAAGLDGAALGQGGAGACNLAAVTTEEALEAAKAASHAALGEAGAAEADVKAVCAGVAGASVGTRRLQFEAGLQALFPGAKIAVVPDYAIALTGATDHQPGMIVIAGTGSVAYGENAAGETCKTGAYGYLIDDAGSGYGVGRLALAAVLRAADGTGEPTSLSQRILEALGLAALADIVPGVYGGEISRVRIAALSHVVAEATQNDADSVARAILMRAGGTLASLAEGVARRLFASSNQQYPVVRIGGLWQSGEALNEVFARSLRRFAPLATLTEPIQTPVQGAVQRALSLQGGVKFQ